MTPGLLRVQVPTGASGSPAPLATRSPGETFPLRLPGSEEFVFGFAHRVGDLPRPDPQDPTFCSECVKGFLPGYE